MGIKDGDPPDISDYVNKLIDTPEEIVEYKRFVKEEIERSIGKKLGANINNILHFVRDKHNSGRRRRTITYLQLLFLSKKGREYVKAWYLHHALDYMMEIHKLFDKREVIRRLREKKLVANVDETNLEKDLNVVLDFIINNWDEIINDFRG